MTFDKSIFNILVVRLNVGRFLVNMVIQHRRALTEIRSVTHQLEVEKQSLYRADEATAEANLN